LHQLVALGDIFLKLRGCHIGNVIRLEPRARFSEFFNLLLNISAKVLLVDFCCCSGCLDHFLQCLVEVHCVVLLRLALRFSVRDLDRRRTWGDRMNNHKTNRRIALPILLVAALLLAGCGGIPIPITTCTYDATLVASLGKTKVDVQKAYKSSRKTDVETARSDVKELVATAERNKTATCSEPLLQTQKIQAIFDKLEFKKGKKAVDQNRLDNLMEAIDLAVATQNQLKK
jgi:hypothetical protein